MYDTKQHAKRLVKKFSADLGLGEVLVDLSDAKQTNKNFDKFEKYLRRQLQQAYDKGIESVNVLVDD